MQSYKTILLIGACLACSELDAMMGSDGGLDEAQSALLPTKDLVKRYEAVDGRLQSMKACLAKNHTTLNALVQSGSTEEALKCLKVHIGFLEEESKLLRGLETVDQQVLSALARDQETYRHDSPGSNETSGVDLGIINDQITTFRGNLEGVAQDIKGNIQALKGCLDQLHEIKVNVEIAGQVFRTVIKADLKQKMDAGEINWDDLTPRLIHLMTTDSPH